MKIHTFKNSNPDLLNTNYKSQLHHTVYNHEGMEKSVIFHSLEAMLKDSLTYAARNPNSFIPVVECYYRGLPMGVEMAMRIASARAVQITFLRPENEDRIAFESNRDPIAASMDAVNLINQGVKQGEVEYLSGRNLIEVELTTIDKAINTLAYAITHSSVEVA
jgi:hypothetical protein